MHKLSQQIGAVVLVLGAARAQADVAYPWARWFAEQRSVTAQPVVFVPAADQLEQTQQVSGMFEPGARDWFYLPIDVPAGVREIAVDYQYDRPSVPAGERGNALDIGVFDPSGIGLGNERGFRGWSGGFRTSFSISASEATPGYLPGPVDAGRWHVIFGPYSVAPQGLRWTANITLRYGEPGAAFAPSIAPERGQGRGRAWYRGDMHLHTVHSDGRRLPEEVAAGARAAGLDFFVSTDHNTSSAHGVWGRHAGADLLILNGEEITTRNGHYLALGLDAGQWIDWRYRADDDVLPVFLEQIHRQRALAVAAHPHCPFVGCSWRFGYDGTDAVEVWNGPWTMDDEVALAGWDNMLQANAHDHYWIPAVGNSDAHSEPQAIALPHNVVYAADLERRALLQGVARGRLWIAESGAVELSFSATAGNQSAGIGERLSVAEDQQVSVRLNVTGAEGAIVRIFTDEAQVYQTTLPTSGPGVVEWKTKPQVSRYVRAEVRRTQDNPALPTTMVALTNPIFLGK